MSIGSKIKNIEGVEFTPSADLTKMTTFRLESQADLAIVRSKDALSRLIKVLYEHQIPYLVLGLGANQILPQTINALVIHLKFEFDSAVLADYRESYELPASLSLTHLTSAAVKHGLSGWEVFTGIPATLGGAIYMNAGTNLGEIGSLIEEVYLIDKTGQPKNHKVTTQSFSYRKNHFVEDGDVIVGARISHRGKDESIPGKIKNYLEYRKNTQPLATKNCGCVFKNPAKGSQAGRLIDQLGLKGFCRGGLQVSLKHANFVENKSSSNWDQFKDLTDTIKWQMNMFYGFEFELEVKIPYH
ncbi:MAG TPA: UDP-N-acetylmuramate dehydrogenase [Bacteriovoracaceae bacterium]|nr:UDP-N-acetylmuramate dehydrogenase [Bacteriovoracaceae bacterium]